MCSYWTEASFLLAGCMPQVLISVPSSLLCIVVVESGTGVSPSHVLSQPPTALVWKQDTGSRSKSTCLYVCVCRLPVLGGGHFALFAMPD